MRRRYPDYKRERMKQKEGVCHVTVDGSDYIVESPKGGRVRVDCQVFHGLGFVTTGAIKALSVNRKLITEDFNGVRVGFTADEMRKFLEVGELA